VPRAARAGAIALGFFMVAACQEPPTQVVVRLATNMRAGPGGDFDAIQLEIIDQDDTIVRSQLVPITETIPGDGTFHVIGTFGVLPLRGDASRRFRVDAAALRQGSPLFKTYVRSSFVRRHTVQLDLYLPAHCVELARTCRPDETCSLAGCVSPEVDPTTLPPFLGDGDPEDPVDPRFPARSYISPATTQSSHEMPRPVAYTIGSDRPVTIHYTTDGSTPRPGATGTTRAAAPVTLPPTNDATIRWVSETSAGTLEERVNALETAMSPPAGDAYNFIVEHVSLNGSGPFVTVAPGAPVELTFDRQMWGEADDLCDCWCITQFAVLVDGVGTVHCDDDPGDMGAACEADGAGWPVYPGATTTAIRHMFTAPRVPGTYQIYAGWSWSASCGAIGPGSTGRHVVGFLFVASP
jgi:hypothetical protein